MVLECQLMRTVGIGLHIQFIDEIMDMKVDEDALDERGICQISKVKSFTHAHDDHSYYRIGEMLS
jgi:flavin reductase (DIM6/NTAB) family NADH-FMN oxidoreductase RutF